MRPRTPSRPALRAALALALAAPGAAAQSAADLRGRLAIDARTADWTAAEVAFRGPDACAALVPPIVCPVDEEPSGDSRASALQDLRQIRVTWDAHNLYIAVEATLGGASLVVLIDTAPGGLERATELDVWRRALRFGPEIEPEFFLAVRDGEPVPELYAATSAERAVRVPTDAFAAAASFEAEAGGRALEAALPWTLLFPDAPLAPDPEPGAPAEPVFVLPSASSAHGLRIAAAVVDASSGLGAADAAPDPTVPIPLDPRSPTVIDRAVFVDWDAAGGGPPHFVDFGASLQTQVAPRFVPSAPAAPVALRLLNLRTFAGGAASRLVVPDVGLALAFAFDVEPPAPAIVYVSASVFSLRGDRVLDLYRDAPRSAGAPPPPFGPFGDATRDLWDGSDAAGRGVPGGLYVLQVDAALAPGATVTSVRRGITVVR